MTNEVKELLTKKDLTPEESAQIDLDIRIDALTGQMLGQTYTNDYEFNKKLLGILTDAVDARAHAEGVAEGEEQERVKILANAALVKEGNPLAACSLVVMGMSVGRDYLPYADCDILILDASLLAPKEDT